MGADDGRRVHEVKHYAEIEGLRAEGPAHWHVADGAECEPEVIEMARNFTATLNGNVYFGPEAEQWGAIKSRLGPAGPRVWVEMIRPVGISYGSESYMPPPVDTYINRLHIARVKPAPLSGD